MIDYWVKIHPGDHLPSRKEFDPMDIPRLLPHISMMDVERDPFRLKIRLLGTAINNAFERDFTGKYFDEVFPDYENSVGYHQRKEVAETGMPKHFFGQGKLRYNLDFKSVEWILLPLASDGETVDLILSAISYGGE
nr:PAS domain-containing protein [Sneathiella limimaris]